ncbi:lissencephaly-1 homolog [Branchiostoma floridae]|uniref:Lissencephaly-1 homolog n=1 Tax=Branchiostoma floridae TaxID=7739 RepID=A0A9J7K6D3_BRAFL|nr:lissencephaly-1 homolog [Branchiostoma floridae]
MAEVDAESSSSSALSVPFDCLLEIFGYLDGHDLAKVSRVCKNWHDAAQTPLLWKHLCLQRWLFCNLSNMTPGEQAWQEYYIHRHAVDTSMGRGAPKKDYRAKTLRGHKGQIHDAVYLSKKEVCFDTANFQPILASCSEDKTVRVWNITEGSELWVGTEHRSAVTCLVLWEEESILCSGDQDGDVHMWDCPTGQNRGSLRGHDGGVTKMVVYKSGGYTVLLAGTGQGDIKMWDLRNTAACLKTFPAVPGMAVNILSLHKDRTLAVASSDGGGMKLYDLERLLSPEGLMGDAEDCQVGELEHPSLQHTCCITWLPWKPNMAAIGYRNGDIGIWDLKPASSGREKGLPVLLHITSAHFGAVRGLSAVHNMLVSASTQDVHLKTWSLQNDGSLTEEKTYTDHQGPVTGIHVDHYKAVSCSDDFSIRVYQWGREGGSRVLDSKYTLLGGSLQRASGFQSVLSDYTSCVGISGNVLKAYTFTT